MLNKSDITLPEYSLSDFFRWLEFKKRVGWDKTVFVAVDQLPTELTELVRDYSLTAAFNNNDLFETVTYETTLPDERRLKILYKNNKVRIYLNNVQHISLLKTSDCKHVSSNN
jgi:hypothetical protein